MYATTKLHLRHIMLQLSSPMRRELSQLWLTVGIQDVADRACFNWVSVKCERLQSYWNLSLVYFDIDTSLTSTPIILPHISAIFWLSSDKRAGGIL